MNHDAQDLRAQADATVAGIKRAGDELLRMNQRLSTLDAQIKKVKTELLRTLKTTTSISETISEKSHAGEPFDDLTQHLENLKTEQCDRALCHIDPLRTLDGDAWMSDDCPKRASLEIWAKMDVFGDLKRSLEKTTRRSWDLTIARVLDEGAKAQVRELNSFVVHPSIKLAEQLDKEISRAEDRLTILEGTIKYLTHGIHNDLDKCDATRLYRTGITRVRTLDEITRVEEAERSYFVVAIELATAYVERSRLLREIVHKTSKRNILISKADSDVVMDDEIGAPTYIDDEEWNDIGTFMSKSSRLETHVRSRGRQAIDQILYPGSQQRFEQESSNQNVDEETESLPTAKQMTPPGGSPIGTMITGRRLEEWLDREEEKLRLFDEEINYVQLQLHGKLTQLHFFQRYNASSLIQETNVMFEMTQIKFYELTTLLATCYVKRGRQARAIVQGYILLDKQEKEAEIDDYLEFEDRSTMENFACSLPQLEIYVMQNGSDAPNYILGRSPSKIGSSVTTALTQIEARIDRGDLAPGNVYYAGGT
ncbi:hypothetical protein E8E13_003277 [Curvularia kusanoi]|uniref:Uncharacterized protein n=1 Tax=Curvularia kusanoi TaxID=90978 RepID=A0A9P4T4Z6_CURKU|nr:hypothetical protein E8E13_003277 [Curvularia kusanoi]